MTVVESGYQDVRQAMFRLPQQQRLQLIKDAILTFFSDDQSDSMDFDFDATLSDIQNAFVKAGPLTDQDRDDARYAYLMEKHGP